MRLGDAQLIIREDNAKVFETSMKQAITRGLEKVGMECERRARALCHRVTGRLANSITHQFIDETSIAVGTNVEYGKYEELKRGHEFLVPAASDNADRWRSILESELKNA